MRGANLISRVDLSSTLKHPTDLRFRHLILLTAQHVTAALRQLDADVELIERTLAARFTGSAELLDELRRQCSTA